VKEHVESTPLFQRYGVEDQLSAMYQPVVQLKSGGYLVINPTEALVSIDINSGRSTREHNIEQTAYATNLEAAAEIARQLRLRDMAGLVVIDFIDMEQNGHVRKVEKAMKEALKNDRARIQVGRISSFGLMEMSRQRLRTGVLEASTKPCPHCEGTGLMRTAASAGLSALRIVEDEAARGRGDKIVLRAGRDAAVYVLNKKRSELGEIESRYGVSIEVVIDEALEGAKMTVESSGPRPVAQERPKEPTPIEEDLDEVEELLEDEEFEDEEQGEEREESGERAGRDDDREDRPGRRRRRRRRGGRGRRRGGPEGQEGGEEHRPAEDVAEIAGPAAQPDEQPADETAEAPEAEEKPKRDRRRRKAKPAVGAEVAPESSPMVERPIDEEPAIASTDAPAEPKPKRSRKKKAEAAEPAPPEAPPAETADEPKAEQEAPKPKRRAASRKKAAEPAEEAPKPAEAAAVPSADNDPNGEESGPPRRGWWQRTFG
jgi:ribonuclease E